MKKHKVILAVINERKKYHDKAIGSRFVCPFEVTQADEFDKLVNEIPFAIKYRNGKKADAILQLIEWTRSDNWEALQKEGNPSNRDELRNRWHEISTVKHKVKTALKEAGYDLEGY